MELDRFLTELIEMNTEIHQKVDVIENDREKGMQEMPELLNRLTSLMPKWFYFIDQTGIGTKENILLILRDMEEAMQREDSILLADALLYGLHTIAEEYIEVIKEALYEE